MCFILRLYLPGILPLTAAALLLSACFTSRVQKRRPGREVQQEIIKSPVFSRSFTGFTLLDPETGKTLADVNGDKYFTPASNVKILTLATCLQVLGDSVPAFQFEYRGDSLFFRETGDPTFLNSRFNFWQKGFELLRNAPAKRIYRLNRPQIEPFGPGWAWEDYEFEFSARRKNFPVYGGLVKIKAVGPDSLTLEPPFFRKYLHKNSTLDSGRMEVRQDEMRIFYAAKTRFDQDYQRFVSINWTSNAVEDILWDTLNREILSGHNMPMPNHWRTLYSTPLDTVLRRIMYQSDNFIAEQMLLVCAVQKFDTLEQSRMIQWMLDSVLINLPQRPRWVDGSGLSRYNLASPRDFSTTLLKLWQEQPREYLLSLFPAGGMNGTVAGWYKGPDNKPFVFAKSGSMSGVQCLSGYIVTKRGKVLIFSFMHNNFVGSGKPWKEEMGRILEKIRSRY
ncbi:MAG: D-alanyl-D-alanine carboxypeptidase [Lewinellaceae bacterium]|nr:D-alanyl-D-alanine carboxypeptidase [Lewinellaceae bacterium]